MSGSEQTQARGRVSEDSRDRILIAGRSLFFEHGYAGVTTDHLAKASKTSKTTIYKAFGNMEGVLRAVIERECHKFSANTDEAPKNKDSMLISIATFGENLISLLNDPDAMNFDRLVHEAARSNQHLAQLYYDEAFIATRDALAKLIAHGQANGFVARVEPATDLAEHLVVMWDGYGIIRARLGLTLTVNEDPARWAHQCAKTLLFPETD